MDYKKLILASFIAITLLDILTSMIGQAIPRLEEAFKTNIWLFLIINGIIISLVMRLNIYQPKTTNPFLRKLINACIYSLTLSIGFWSLVKLFFVINNIKLILNL